MIAVAQSGCFDFKPVDQVGRLKTQRIVRRGRQTPDGARHRPLDRRRLLFLGGEVADVVFGENVVAEIVPAAAEGDQGETKND